MRYSILLLCLLTVLGISSHAVINERDNGLRLECNYVADSNGNIEEALHYYPFGMLIAESVNTTLQSYKYNGKELYRARIVYTHGSSSDDVLINNHKDEDVSSSYSIAKMLESKGALDEGLLAPNNDEFPYFKSFGIG